MNNSYSRRVAVIGGGAIGGYFAAAAQAGGHEVTLCVNTAMSQLTIESDGSTRNVSLTIASTPEGLKPVAWIFLAVKSQDTQNTAPWFKKLLSRDTTVVVLQNGIDQVERVRMLTGDAVVIPSIIYIGTESPSPGYVRHFAGNKALVPQSSQSVCLARLLAPGKIDIVQTEDFITTSWRKMMANAVIGPITALTMRRVNVIEDHVGVQVLTRSLLKEVMDVGRATGANLNESDVEAVFQIFLETGAKGLGTSMLSDRQAGRPAEHEHLSGTVLRMASRHGVEAPLLMSVHALLDALDETVRK